MSPTILLWRGAAAVIDSMLFGVLLGIISGVADAAGSDASERLSDTQDPGSILLIFAGYGAYYLLFEWLTGTSPGKRIFRLWVVTESGERIDGTAAFMRNLVRPVDALFVYGIGVLSALLSPNRQRLGDRAAGTIVIRRPRSATKSADDDAGDDKPSF